MTFPNTHTEDETLRAEYEALMRELGPDGLIQYIQQTRPGKGDYTAERHKLLDGLSVTEIEKRWERRRAAVSDTRDIG